MPVSGTRLGTFVFRDNIRQDSGLMENIDTYGDLQQQNFMLKSWQDETTTLLIIDCQVLWLHLIDKGVILGIF